MKKILFVSLFNLFWIFPGLSQITYVDTQKDGQGGIDGMQYPKNIITDSTGNELFVVAYNAISHIRKSGFADSYETVESIKYSSSPNIGLWNADEVKSCMNGKYLYVTGDNNIVTLKYDAEQGKLMFLESLQNRDGLMIGDAGLSSITISPDNKNLYLATSYGSKAAMQIFSIDQSTGLLTHKNSMPAGIVSSYFTSNIISPSGKNVYTLWRGYNNIDTVLNVYKRITDRDSLELIQVLTQKDSINNAYKMAISPDNKNLYLGDEHFIMVYEIDPETGLLTYIGKLNIASCFEGFSFPNMLTFSQDGNYLYLGGYHDISVYERNPLSGALNFIQVVQESTPGFSELNSISSIYLSDHDSILYATTENNNSFHVFSRNAISGKISFIKRITKDQGKIFGLSYASDLLISADNKTLITLASSGLSAIAIFDRMENGRLNFRRNLELSELGPPVGQPGSISLSGDGLNMYITSQSMYSIRLMKKDPVVDFAFSESYDYAGTGMTSEEGIYESALTKDSKKLFVLTPLHIVSYQINQSNGTLIFKSNFGVSEDSKNGFRGMRSFSIRPDDKFLYTCSNSEFYPRGINAYRIDPVTGALTFFQSIRDIRVHKVLISADNKFVYALGDIIYCFKIDELTEKLALIDEIDIETLGYSQVTSLEDGILSEDGRTLFGITRQGKPVISFYRNKETGLLTFTEIQYYSSNTNYSNDGPKIIVSHDSRNAYIVSPYDESLYTYSLNIPLGLPNTSDACDGDSAFLFVDPGYEYEWSNGKTTNSFKTIIPGLYTVYVKDSLGREGWDKTNVVFHSSPEVDLELEEYGNTTDSIHFLDVYVNGGEWPFNYLWNNGSEDYRLQIFDSQILANPNFSVTVTDKNYCSDSDTMFISLSGNRDIVKNPEHFIYPNPFSDKIIIEFSNPLTRSSVMEVFDTESNLINQFRIEEGTLHYEIDAGSYLPGTYLIKIWSEDGIFVNKVVKQVKPEL